MPSTQSIASITCLPHSPSPTSHSIHTVHHHITFLPHSPSPASHSFHTVHHYHHMPCTHTKYQVPSIQSLPPKPSSVTCIIQWECMPLQDILQGTVLGGTRACAQVQRTQPILQYKQNWSNNSMFFKNKTVMPNKDLLRILVCWQEETANYTLSFTHTLHVFLFLCVLFMTFC